ncbi:ABC transporter ATP-binding protein [Dethiosulfatarculus sandiegensis]|uniref:Peptide ABC transporter ATP-binding protein n=1 Tax=Dethiosulfatarculus sandiegensis TaxID=1429043 RepID=A0A0D2JMZ7_9BACT|nr:ABC transporter ATP-binding protein [Dethiosulfatarculus sandiegensis]KIX10865.1 peptide ABC transporter ATP-binding protein [Dethiosulfatarculus sandiegensis]
MTETELLLEVDNLQTHFFSFDGVAKAVDGVSFNLKRGETLGLVGESGCGKSVTALSIMRLIQSPPGKITGGRILFNGTDLLKLSNEKMRRIRGDRISMIFQEPMTSLNPVYTIADQIKEVFVNHRNLDKKAAFKKAVEVIRKVHIPSPDKRAEEYPHQLSGGMRQRAMIAMALACNPDILIADEPTTALDVSIQAQIIDLMLKLKEEFNAAILMITHDLGVIAEMAQRVLVMYAGRVVEEGTTQEIFDNPLHPYTRGLMNAVPVIGRRATEGRKRLQEIPGVVPSLFDLPKGCAFHPRCPEAFDLCRKMRPDMSAEPGVHRAACWLAQPRPGEIQSCPAEAPVSGEAL